MNNSDMPAGVYPDVHHENGQIEYGCSGLTKREYFVARAMHGICGNPNAHTMAPDAIARRSMSVAKTVLAALEQEQAK